ncbi:hypothetical protein BVG19_g464 [[Candida] boidinii]|nr:hypothetical protein BVG19_g464 [[Candida] boidinii]OWB50257.1 hypothetical protein B5S27_g1805 [[Candida] boidinii]
MKKLNFNSNDFMKINNSSSILNPIITTTTVEYKNRSNSVSNNNIISNTNNNTTNNNNNIHLDHITTPNTNTPNTNTPNTNTTTTTTAYNNNFSNHDIRDSNDDSDHLYPLFSNILHNNLSDSFYNYNYKILNSSNTSVEDIHLHNTHNTINNNTMHNNNIDDHDSSINSNLDNLNLNNFTESSNSLRRFTDPIVRVNSIEKDDGDDEMDDDYSSDDTNNVEENNSNNNANDYNDSNDANDSKKLISRNASAVFFSDNVEDNSDNDYTRVNYDDKETQVTTTTNTKHNTITSTLHWFDEMNKPKIQNYTNEIPFFYLPEKVNYPFNSPYEYTDEEFEKLNHFEFLKSLNLQEPPLLPPYLNSNLLNDSSSHNYKTYPYQYQYSNHIYINDQYNYNINNLNLMDKYSKQKFKGISNKSITSNAKNLFTTEVDLNANDNDNNGNKIRKINKENDIPSHVMLNHLITCNLKSDMNDVIIGSCIHRYSGKFITQIVYFPMDLQ